MPLQSPPCLDARTAQRCKDSRSRNATPWEISTSVVASAFCFGLAWLNVCLTAKPPPSDGRYRGDVPDPNALSNDPFPPSDLRCAVQFRVPTPFLRPSGNIGGQVDGGFSADGTVNFTQTTQSLLLGNNRYTVSLNPQYSLAVHVVPRWSSGADYIHTSISAQVSAQPNTAPEPTSLTLAGIAVLSVLGGGLRHWCCQRAGNKPEWRMTHSYSPRGEVNEPAFP